MAQLQWTVPGYGGRKYRVGMYHGEDSGHLMVHCNNKVMLIDFGVKDTKNYSFFLDQELFELELTRDNGQFSYNLKHNEDIDSPHNRRREQDKKTSRWRLIAAGIILVFFTGVLLAAWSRKPMENQELISSLALGAGETTEISVFTRNDQWYASYRTDDQTRQIAIGPLHAIETKGLEILPGDRFGGRYLTDQPDLLFIDWNAPADATAERLRRAVMFYHASVHPELSPQQIGCQVRLTYELEGMDGLGILMGQTKEEESTYNQNAYLRLVRSTAFRQGNQECL